MCRVEAGMRSIPKAFAIASIVCVVGCSKAADTGGTRAGNTAQQMVNSAFGGAAGSAAGVAVGPTMGFGNSNNQPAGSGTKVNPAGAGGTAGNVDPNGCTD